MNKLLEPYGPVVAARIDYLIGGYVTESLTEEEHVELNDWIELNDANMYVFEVLTEDDAVEAYLRRFKDGKQS
ncbi:MAG: hypothetical protein EOO03_16065 [Chitinophagaceae bacterium]|nr:MAG: hypothetical protein EOO03_16065 [Chitinophagaceae bacterium]